MAALGALLWAATAAGAGPDDPKARPAAARPRGAADAAAQKAAAALQNPPAGAGKALEPARPDPEVNVEQRLDQALAAYYAHDYRAAAAALHELFRRTPEGDLKRDTVSYYLADSLARLGFFEAAVAHHMDIVAGRRAPELVGRSLVALERLVRAGRLDEWRLIDDLLFGAIFGDLPPEAHDFVEYYQGLGELRRGFAALGTRRLDELGRAASPGRDNHYTWKARYALAVDRLAQKSDKADEAAQQQLKAIIDDAEAPRAVKNEARTALARALYEQKKYAEAYDLYAQNDSPIETQDLILVEKAWAKVGQGDEPLALGQVVGLGAPVYRLGFSPERFLIRAASLDRLCQFRAAHLAVTDFRAAFDGSLRRIRERLALGDDPVLRQAALARADLVPAARWRGRLGRERARLDQVADRALRGYLETIYTSRIAQADAAVNRGLERALEVVAENLLAVDEQMTILDYEIGVGLFKGVSGGLAERGAAEGPSASAGRPQVAYKFTGEYWSDEIDHFEVRAVDRCLR